MKTAFIFFCCTLLFSFCTPSTTATAQVLAAKSIIISEIFPDPTPSFGLPEKEFVELYNPQPDTVQLGGLLLCDADKCYTFSAYKFPPKQFLIVCKASDVISFRPYGNTLGLPSFITLNNDGDAIYLKNNKAAIIDNITYTAGMVKEGKTLEILSLLNRCNTASNSKPSTAKEGGTPGKASAEQQSQNFPPKPIVQNVALENDSVAKIILNDAIDSLSLNQLSIVLDNEPVVAKKILMDNAYNSIVINFPRPFVPNFSYQLQLNNLKDCFARSVLQDTTLILLLPSTADSMDVIINEILFNPKVGGVDFVELNNANKVKIIDLKNWSIANFQNGIISNIKIISTQSLLLKPNQTLAITSDTIILKNNYATTGHLFTADLPAFNDDKGTAILISPKGKLMDRLDYNEDMHFEMLKKTEGISLERIYTYSHTNDVQNWHSAAENAGFATPGLPNSQARDLQNTMENEWSVEPIAFNPSGGSNKDFTTIHYQSSQYANAVASLSIFDAAGRLVKNIAKNTTLSTLGFLRWDGTDNDGGLVPIGQYILYIQVVQLDGTIQELKKQVVVTSL